MTYAPDHALIATPIGLVGIWGDDDWVHRISIFPDGPPQPGTRPAVREAAAQISAYFDSRLQSLDPPILPAQSERGSALRAGIVGVGYGETLSYGALARTIGSGARAVGQACARNPFPLVVPCHRIVAAGGALGAYSAGDGPATKQWLLQHEARISGKETMWVV